jgi:hypothetical protein
MSGNMRVLLGAKYILDGATVTKLNGKQKYTLRRSIKIYGENQQEIQCEVDNVFLIDEHGNINMISESTELMVHLSSEDLYHDLYDVLMWDDK